MITSPSPSPSSSRTTPKGGGGSGTTAKPPPSQPSKWRSGAVRGVYGRRLLDALRATGGGGGQPQPRAVKAAADSALALTARGQTRWSRAILLAGAACSRRRVLVKAGGKVRRRRRPPPPSSQQARDSAAALLKGKGAKEQDRVQERLRVLGRLVPGCRKLPAPALLDEAADYVAALQMQVSTMRALADALAAAQLSSPADAEAEAEAAR